MNEDYAIHRVSSSLAELIISNYHYLTNEGASFRSGYNYGLFVNGNELLYGTFAGLAIFHSPSVPETFVGCFGVSRDNQDGFFELGRFVMNPNTYERNLSSWFLSRTIKRLRRSTLVRAILTYADTRYHSGFLYQATNFKYYGLTSERSDFWIKQGKEYIKHNRGPTKDLDGEWRPRPQKHRYLMVFDESLKCLWGEKEYPKDDNTRDFNYDLHYRL